MKCCFSQRQEITLLEKRRHSLNFPVWGKPNFMLRIFIFSNFVFIFSWKDHLYFAWLEYLYFQTLYSCFHDKDVYMIKVLIFLFLSYLIKVQGISYHAEMTKELNWDALCSWYLYASKWVEMYFKALNNYIFGLNTLIFVGFENLVYSQSDYTLL